MRFYAERPTRVARQLIADVLAVGWVVVLVFAGLAVRELVLQLQGPARSVAQAGDAISGAFSGAARTASGVPLFGGQLATALGQGTTAGTGLADAGRQSIDVIAAVATGSAVAIIVVGALPVLLVWLPLRIRYARAARSALAVRDVDDDLLALRAMTRLPVRTLLSVSPDPAAAWRRGDAGVVRELAALELANLGLKKPSPVAMSPTEPIGM